MLVRLLPLLLSLLPLLASGQAIPPQCDPKAFAKPTIVTFLGPARSLTVGASPPLPLLPPLRYIAAASAGLAPVPEMFRLSLPEGCS